VWADDCDARTAQKINHLVKHRLRIEGHRTTMMGDEGDALVIACDQAAI
jgi:hypothetical protein